ncbi:unnamed protein product [Trichogramma brassicae]|uniref:Uncharacterized protein n=1 Tax=Trichogramma brassicae TaxID=86971 RepID=A0A6H5HZZ5_9HYME|nr:unnamed protein product [Trichogramma brassicae]
MKKKHKSLAIISDNRAMTPWAGLVFEKRLCGALRIVAVNNCTRISANFIGDVRDFQ